jgi:hypothetical protein
MLLLAVPLDRFRVPLPILLLVVGMRIAPLFPAFLHHLGVEGIGANLFAVIIPAAMPLALALAANELLRMISGSLKDLLTVRATAITHQAAPDQNAIESFCPEALLNLNPPPKKSPHIETPIEFFTASPPMGLLLTKPVGLLLFLTGADTIPQRISRILSGASWNFGLYHGPD